MLQTHLIALGLLVASAPLASAQTTARVSTAAAERPNLSGTWSIDRDISNDPAQAAFDAPVARPDRSGGGNPRGGGWNVGGFGVSRRGGSRGQGDSRSERRDAAGTADERNQLRELTDVVKRSSASLVIAHADPSLAITDAQGRTHVFQTSGTRDTHALATATVSSTTRWDGPRLITEYDLGSLGKLVSSYTLLAATRQLVVRTRLEVPERQRSASPELKLVYRLTAPAKGASPPDSGSGAVYDALGGGHVIKDVSADGRYVTLEDRSRWEIHPLARFQTAEWQPPAGATVRNARAEDGYAYQIVNTDEDEGVLALCLARP